MTNNELLYKLVKIELEWAKGLWTIDEAKELMHETLYNFLNNN